MTLIKPMLTTNLTSTPFHREIAVPIIGGFLPWFFLCEFLIDRAKPKTDGNASSPQPRVSCSFYTSTAMIRMYVQDDLSYEEHPSNRLELNRGGKCVSPIACGTVCNRRSGNLRDIDVWRTVIRRHVCCTLWTGWYEKKRFRVYA